ncbi:MAG: endo alpha-1,4 polygalactosaminidase [Planctomycetota bacterium]
MSSWAIQLQGVTLPGAADRLLEARVDMLVIEPCSSIRGMEMTSTRELVRRIRLSRGRSRERKLCIAYLNIGQAEDYRIYWRQDEWRIGSPDFLLGKDPDGWAGNYPVAFWDPRWRRILCGNPASLLDQILAAGFDGVYMDWVLGYQDPTVLRAAESAGIDAARAMVELIAGLRSYARSRRPGFLLIAQNGAGLACREPVLLELIDGFAQEDLLFRGDARAAWEDPSAGDLPGVRPEDGDPLSRGLEKSLARGIPVFSLDYAIRPENVRKAYETNRRRGLVPFVSRTPLDRLPVHVLQE